MPCECDVPHLLLLLLLLLRGWSRTCARANADHLDKATLTAGGKGGVVSGAARQHRRREDGDVHLSGMLRQEQCDIIKVITRPQQMVYISQGNLV